MLWLKKKKMKKANRHTHEIRSNSEVVQAKKHTTRKINEVNSANEQLRQLMNNDGITLRIHIASGGGQRNAR